jgi:hypothetical protein
MIPVKGSNGNQGVGPDQDIYALDVDVAPALHNVRRYRAVPRTDVKDFAALPNSLGENFSKDLDPPSMYKLAMYRIENRLPDSHLESPDDDLPGEQPLAGTRCQANID